MFIVHATFGNVALIIGTGAPAELKLALQYLVRKPALSACGAVPVIGAVPPAAVRQVSHPIEHAWDLRRYDESSKGATARQHNSGTDSLLPNREDADGVRRTEKTLVGCADPPSPLLRGSVHPIRVLEFYEVCGESRHWPPHTRLPTSPFSDPLVAPFRPRRRGWKVRFRADASGGGPRERASPFIPNMYIHDRIFREQDNPTAFRSM